MCYGGCVIWQLGTIDIRYVGEAFRQIEEVAWHNSLSGIRSPAYPLNRIGK
jgi:hypothetical protein